MKVLVLPDVHGRKFWRETIANNDDKVDKVIFLGDYLDPYPNEIDSNPHLMECNSFYDSDGLLNMLNDILALKLSNPSKYVLLTGNHTDSYIWSKFARATRTDEKNYTKYQNFFHENLDWFNLVWVEDDVIFSHAGITEKWANEVWNELEYPTGDIPSIMEIAIMFKDTPLKDFNNVHIDLISDISYYRWGNSECGSCEWADLREHNLENTGVYQVFGHTQLNKPIINDKWACLDCRRGFIIDTHTYEIEEC